MAASTRGAGTNQEGVRRHNLGTLLRQVHRTSEISRAELTAAMGLNRSTIAGLVGELAELGLIEHADPTTPAKGGAGRRTAGRPSAGVRVVDNGPYVVAVDLGVDRAVVARIGLGGRIGERAEAPIDPQSEAWQVGGTVAQLARQVVSWAPKDAPLLGIGISVPGLVRRTDGLVRQAPNLGWRDVSFGSIVLAALDLDVPVQLGNDADLGALAEHNRGAGVGVDDLIYVSGNVGVGAGIIAGGLRMQGAGGYAGEVGHTRFEPEGELCHCGNRGCWELSVGAHAIATALQAPSDQVVRLGEVLAEMSHPPRELRPIATAIGRGLADVVNSYNPSLVILGGYFQPLFGLMRAEIAAGLAERAMAPALESVRLAAPGLGFDAVLLGAAEIAFEPVFDDPVAAIATAVTDAGSRLAG